MRTPSHTTLCSFLFSTILTSAFVPSSGKVAFAAAGAPAAQMAVQSALDGLRAEGFAGAAGISLPAPAAVPTSASASAAPAAMPSAPGSLLTPDLMNKMIRLIALQGKNGEFPAIYANPLGFSAAGQGWPDHQVNGGTGVIHGFAYSQGSDQDVLLYTFSPDSIHAFRAHRDGKSAAALIVDRKTNQITMRDPGEAQKELDVEITTWAISVDKLIANGK